MEGGDGPFVRESYVSLLALAVGLLSLYHMILEISVSAGSERCRTGVSSDRQGYNSYRVVVPVAQSLGAIDT